MVKFIKGLGSPFGVPNRIITDNGLSAGAVQVQRMDRPLTISGVFPRIFEGENSINVKI